ncbi:MAG TPA: TfoX/Sxy family protein [Firmicutes bacterium]|nr:TfoX/Sxy family protein [Candidatus Fermentithermobacillaceae bacterium]
MGELRRLPNIGPELERQLCEVEIDTVEKLKSVGSREAWLRILSRDPSACLMRLSALEGAIQGIRWHDLDETTKRELKDFYREAKGLSRGSGNSARRKTQ